MFYLKEAHLKGFRTIQDVKIDFHPGINIIIGGNGTGKSNFLKFLYNSLSLFDTLSGEFSSQLSFSTVDNTSKVLNVKGTIEEKNYSNDYYIKEQSLNFLVKEESEVLYEGSNSQLALDNILYSTFLINHGVPSMYPVVASPFNFKISYTGFVREFSELVFNTDTPNYIKSLFISFSFDLNRGRELINKETLKAGLIKVLNVSDVLRNALSLYSNIEDVQFASNYNINQDNDKREFTVSNLYLEFKIDGQWLQYDSLSDGTKRLFYIISEVLTPANFSVRKNGFGRGDNSRPLLLLLEEPELGLHPHQLDKLLHFIRDYSSDFQFIITTHSPSVLDMLNADELDRIIISTLSKEGTVLKHLSSQQIKKAQNYLKSEAYLSDYWRFSDLEN